MQVLIGSMLLLLVIGVPIGYAMGLSSLFFVVFFTDMSPMIVAQRISVGADSMVLLALPFFLLAGEIMNQAKITERLTTFALALIGPPRGGLSFVVIVVNVLIAMVSGAAIASAAAVGSTMVPMMQKKGYDRGYAAALNAAAATVGPVIPPSVGFIIYASVSGTSVGKLFLAGAVPGLLMGSAMIGVSAAIAYRKGHPGGERHNGSTIRKSFLSALPALLMPVVILGGIFGGIMTPTEAGAVAVGYGLLAGLLIYRSLRLRDLPRILFLATKRTSSILIIIAGAACFGFLISREIDGGAIVGLFASVTEQRWVLMLLLIGIILVLGMFMEGGSIMIILTPLLLPVLAVYEIDAIHFGVVFQVAIMIGLLTPPVGMLLFVLAGVTGAPVTQIVRHMWPFYLMMFGLVVLIAFVPGLSLWLVEAIGEGVKLR